jgi:hypothetical protein
MYEGRAVDTTNRLQCIEYGCVSQESERNWTARLTVDEDEPVEAVVYCPECAAREFGYRAEEGSP